LSSSAKASAEIILMRIIVFFLSTMQRYKILHPNTNFNKIEEEVEEEKESHI